MEGRLRLYEEDGEGHSYSLEYSYTDNKLTYVLELINGYDRGTRYTYDEDDRLVSVKKAYSKRTYTYDDLNRVCSTVTSHKDEDILTTNYGFAAPTEDTNSTTSGQIASMTHTAAGYNSSYSYTYDKNGNILTISDGTNTTSYVYDSANQLIRENNQAGNYTYTWEYDNAGNILSRTEYTYTTGDLGEPTDTVTYTYGDSEWGDLLTAYDGTAITYDGIGNPLSDGTWTYTWQHGRQLASMTDGTTTWSYTYNADGMRIGRTDGTTTYEYIYAGSEIIYTIIDGVPLRFSHTTDGTPLSVVYKGGTYYYVTNLQGDVVAILDEAGNQVVGYTYDAWGNLLSVTGSMADTLGTANPLRYRGYVYDNETGLYYLQSRYYDPEVGRFLNADGQVSGVGGDFLGYNQFAYCFNNPVNMNDDSGNWPKWLKNTTKWIAKHIVKPVVKAVQKALSKVDLTYSTGINISGTLGAVIFNGQVGISMDTKGNIAIQGSGGGGFTGGTPCVSVTAYKSVTNAPSINKLEGTGYQIGGSAIIPVEGFPLAVGGDFNIIPDSELGKTYYGTTTTIGVGFGEPGGEFHVEWGATGTWRATQINIFDIAEDTYIEIMEW